MRLALACYHSVLSHNWAPEINFEFIYLFIIYLFIIYLFIYSFIYLFIYLFIHL